LKYFFLLFIGLFFSAVTQAQSNFTTEYQFLSYLINNNKMTESDIEFNKVDLIHLNTNQLDSFYYLWGWKNYSTKQLNEACDKWKHVTNQSVFYNKVQFFSAYNFIYLKKYDDAYSLLNQLVKSNDKLISATALFQISCTKLLQNNYQTFDSISLLFDTTQYQLNEFQHEIKALRNEKKNLKMRSPILAGVLSAIVPGVGKIYANKTKQGVALMLPMLMFGGVTYELYHKDGIQSASFISAASVFTLFYIGNIVGSIYATKISYIQKSTAIENKILFDMHIPLRNIFN
jgi:TM2 domain-containing membrane protein YozV